MDILTWVSTCFFVQFVWISIDTTCYYRTQIPMPPLISNNRWIFPVVWFVIYSLLGTMISLQIFFLDATSLWHIGLGLVYYINVFANKWWSPVFFQWRWMWLAYLLVGVMLLTNFLYATFIIVTMVTGVGSIWLIFSVLIEFVYSMWLFIALYFMWYSHKYEKPKQ